MYSNSPSKYSTENLLEALAEFNVKVTLFCVGQNAQLNPELLKRAYDEGHVIANHSWAHRRGGSLGFNQGDHIDESAHQIASVIGREPRLYRPPWGWLTPWEGQRLHQRGYTIVGWDVYTLDWRIPEVDGVQVAQKAIADTKPGSILLFHDAYVAKEVWYKDNTVQAMRYLIPRLQEAGYSFVTIPELLNVPAYASNN